jgi:hypothetical protein
LRRTDRKDWQEGLPMKTIAELRAIVHDFKQVLEFELQPDGWMKDESRSILYQLKRSLLQMTG